MTSTVAGTVTLKYRHLEKKTLQVDASQLHTIMSALLDLHRHDRAALTRIVRVCHEAPHIFTNADAALLRGYKVIDISDGLEPDLDVCALVRWATNANTMRLRQSSVDQYMATQTA